MLRVTLFVMLVVVGLTWADEEEQTCEKLDDCDCGSVCADGKCQEGCMVYDQFMPADSESEVYGRMCQCLADPDEEGRPILCAEDVKFEGAPDGVKMYVHNDKCDGPVPEIAP